MNDVSVCQQHFDELSDTYRIRSIKVYRMELAEEQAVPVLPCLDHAAMLHQRIPPHAAAYLENRTSHDLHEIVFIPESSLIEVDIISTDAEASQDSREQLRQELSERFPTYRIKEKGLSYLRGDRRVMKACRAQVSLRDVLNGDDFDLLERSIERLQTIGALMEKESRVASWGVRTITGPLLATTGFLIYSLLGRFTPEIGEFWSRTLQYSSVGFLGAIFVYYGLKAVHLTEMANRVWKRAAEYRLIVSARRRLRTP